MKLPFIQANPTGLLKDTNSSIFTSAKAGCTRRAAGKDRRTMKNMVNNIIFIKILHSLS
jgi:hypothetical protein